MAKKKKKTTKASLVKSAKKSVSKKAKKAKKNKSKKQKAAKATKQTKKKAAEQQAASPAIPSGLGSFGNTIVFSVSGNKTLPFSGMKREIAGRWKEHEIIGKKPKSEFCGPESQEVKMTITLSAEHGVKPRDTMDSIASACENGTVDYLVIGGKIVGTGKMKIKSVGETWERILNKGELQKATLDVTFTEYN